jgi:uncharacterized protein with PQ loop repeat
MRLEFITESIGFIAAIITLIVVIIELHKKHKTIQDSRVDNSFKDFNYGSFLNYFPRFNIPLNTNYGVL